MNTGNNLPVRSGKFVRLEQALLQQLEHASQTCGVRQQKLVSDALTLYFNPADLGACAQHVGLLQRLQMG